MTSDNPHAQERIFWPSKENAGLIEVPLSLQEWFKIETFSDLLASHADMETILPVALSFILRTYQRPAGILLVQSPMDPAPLLSIRQNIDESLEVQLNDAGSDLMRLSQEVLKAGRPVHSTASLGLAAAVPVCSQNECQGILFLCGATLENGELLSLQRLARPLSRMIKANRSYTEVSRWQLLRSRNTLRALFDNIPASIYIIDQKYMLVALNLTRATLANSKPSSLVGKPCYDALYQRGDICPGCRVGETLSYDENTSRTRRQRGVNGDPIEWEISTYPIRGESGEVVQAILLEQDVTEKRRLEATVAQSEKLAAVGQLAAGVAHEINNPLTAILANAQMLQRELPAQDDRQELVELIAEAGNRATQVVRNLLDLAREEQYEFTPTNINENIRKALALIQHETSSRSVQLSFEPAKDLPVIMASQDHIQGVWINLVVNAIDALGDEGGEIHITTHKTGSQVRVRITDTGKGIPPERLPRIFEPFYTTKAPGQGTGLGLSVCHRIVKLHGGQILVNSQMGKGTEFTVILPTSQERIDSSGQD